MDHMFRAYDIRGIFGKDLTCDVMLNIGKALGTYVKKEYDGKPISLGYDIRTSSPALAMCLKAGLNARGITVIDAGEVAFGEALFTGWRSEVPLIAFITASHLKSEWNGLKLYYGDGVGFPTEEIMRLKEMVKSCEGCDETWENVGYIRDVNMHQEYVGHFADTFKLGDAGLKVAVDCGSGAACLNAPDIMRAVGFDVVEVFCKPDPSYPTRDPEPADEHLGELKKVVVEQGCSFGVAFDGDGDRAVIVDDLGRTLGADVSGTIMAQHLVENGRPKMVIANVESSRVIESVLEPMGVEVMRIKVGHTFLTLEAKKHNAAIGIERSGHIIVPEVFLFDDAMVVPPVLGRVLADHGGKLSELVDALPKFNTRAVKVDAPDETKFDVIERLQEKFKAEYDKVNTMDGARVDLDKGWVLIRASNTSPMIRLTAEADTEEDLDALIEQFEKVLRAEIE